MDLSVVIPVRDEAANVVPLVAELRAALDGLLDYEILYVDDGSEDGTAALAQKAATESGASQRVKIHSAASLPPGWTGKLWALNEGVQVASETGCLPECGLHDDAHLARRFLIGGKSKHRRTRARYRTAERTGLERGLFHRSEPGNQRGA